jgi:nitrite reductase/ring-hydroxylating ferredoxin subunit
MAYGGMYPINQYYDLGGEVVPCNTKGVVQIPNKGCFCPDGTMYNAATSSCISMQEYETIKTSETADKCQIYGQFFNPATGECQCPEGQEVDEQKKMCVKKGSLNKYEAPQGINDIYNTKGSGQGEWNAGLEIGKKDWNLGSTFSLGRNEQGRLGTPTYGLYGSAPSLFGGRGGLKGGINYQSGNSFSGNLGAAIPLSKKNPNSVLSVYGNYGRNLGTTTQQDMANEDASNFMRTPTNPTGNFSGGIGYNTVTPGGMRIKAGVTYNPNREYGGSYNNPGFRALPKSVQSQIMGKPPKAMYGMGMQEGGVVEVTPEQLPGMLQKLREGGYNFEIID